MDAKRLKEVERLQQESEEDGFTLKLNWETLRSRNGIMQNDFFHYEGETLVGFLGLYDFGNKAELCGMVHPGFRRRGIFTGLIEQALKEVSTRCYRKILLNAPGASRSAKGFMDQLPCLYAFSEYQMKWLEMPLLESEEVVIRPAERTDAYIEMSLDVLCFGFTEEEARAYYERLEHEKALNRMIIEANGQVVGKISVDRSGNHSEIYGFSIFPEYQGRGIGRKVLHSVVLEESRMGHDVFLEVEAKNAQALKLYESCGFRTIQRQDYYEIDR